MWEEDLDSRRSWRETSMSKDRYAHFEEKVKESVPDFPLVKSEINKKYWELQNILMTKLWKVYRKGVANNPLRWISEMDVVRFCRQARVYFNSGLANKRELILKGVIAEYLDKYFDLPCPGWDPDEVDTETVMMIGGLMLALCYELELHFGTNHSKKTITYDIDDFESDEASTLHYWAFRIVNGLGYSGISNKYEKIRFKLDGCGDYRMI